MRQVHRCVRRRLAAFVVCATPLAAQRAPTPALQPARVLGEAAVALPGFVLGAESGLVVAAGVAYLVRGHGGDVTEPGLQKALTVILVGGGGLDAGTSAWLASRANGQTSRWGWDVGAATAVTAIAFRVAGWPMTPASRARKTGRWRRLAPVWMSAAAATVAATATRAQR